LRETFKSLSIFSAMLLVLLLVSSGCVVNIPGFGKRTLPFFKKVSDTLPVAPHAAAGSPVPVTNPVLSAPSAAKPAASASVPTPDALHPKAQGEMEISMAPDNSAPTAVAPTATATPIPEMEEFAYTLLQNQKPALWTMNSDGTNPTRLSPPGSSCWYPLWAPSGKLLAFISDQGVTGKPNLFVIKKGDKQAQQLTFLDDLTLPSPASIKAPISWSPKSDKIAYIYHKQIWEVDVETQSSKSLFTPSDPSFSIWGLEWAPYRDNKSIAFLLQKGEKAFALWLVNPRLLDQLQLTDIRYSAQDFSWSSDTRQVAYLVDSSFIYTASSETSIPQPVIQNASPELGPMIRYSPAETGSDFLLVLAKKDLSEQDYRVALVDQKSKDPTDTGTLKYLSEPGVTNALWSPDGQKIAYLQSGNLWVMNLDGSAKTEVSIAGIQSPDWSRK
jgi:Tol biopolymer transport system component